MGSGRGKSAYARGPELVYQQDCPENLVSLLLSRARIERELIFVDGQGLETRLSYLEFVTRARRAAAGLEARGLGPGDPILLQLGTPIEFLCGFWGCVLVGAVPVFLTCAPSYSVPNAALAKLLDAAELLNTGTVLCGSRSCEGLSQGAPNTSHLEAISLASCLKNEPGVVREACPDDTAAILMTSGSSAKSKGVPLTHGNFLAMTNGIVQTFGFHDGDVTLNWMPLEHVGAISFLHVMPVLLKSNQLHMPTSYVLGDPLRLLDLIERHRGSISWAPNFAFSLFIDLEEELKARSWDLSSARFLVNAGEPVVAATTRKFLRLLQPHGLPERALRPAFGMSETCAGVTLSVQGFTLANTEDALSHVELGPCIPGAEMRVVSDSGELLLEGEVGALQFKGPSIFTGYIGPGSRDAFVDEWFDSGDLALIQDGLLYITGRQKETLIVNGVNYSCHEIEQAAEEIEGLRRTFTVATGVRASGQDTESLALFLCPADEGRDVLDLARTVKSHVQKRIGIPIRHLVRLSPSDVPKSDIGKLLRRQLRVRFEQGEFEEHELRPSESQGASEVRPASDTVARLLEIWRGLHKGTRISVNDNFFDLGGDSLLLVEAQTRVREKFGVAVEETDLFEHPTIKSLAKFLDGGSSTQVSSASARRVSETQVSSRDIAVIGIGVRFPEAATPAEFWELLINGREAITQFSPEEAIAAGVPENLARHPRYVTASSVLEEPGGFDAEFFGYTGRKAKLIDPQQRIFLEICWETLEHAGYGNSLVAETVGVFASGGMPSYLMNNLFGNRELLDRENQGKLLTLDSLGGFNIMTTNDKDYLPTRVSYHLNLTGPSVSVQTACSSTLVAIHQACNSLLLGDCSMALAGGISIKLPQKAGYKYVRGMINSPDGHCRAYDSQAQGSIFGNGGGAVLLKPLQTAMDDGDTIYAVIKGSSVNNDGREKVGFTAPSVSGERTACAEALRRANVSADTIGFMEGHGTATPLGDPIEVKALSEAFSETTERKGFCALGSVKTNIGHMQVAAGVAGLIKASLALHNKKIPATLHFQRPNERINFTESPFFVNASCLDWPADEGHPRRAAVNSLGIGGTNAHVVLEEAPQKAARAEPVGPFVLPLSGRSVDALCDLKKRYAHHLDQHPELSLADVAFTAQHGRTHFSVRRAFVFRQRDELLEQLGAGLGESLGRGAPSDESPLTYVVNAPASPEPLPEKESLTPRQAAFVQQAIAAWERCPRREVEDSASWEQSQVLFQAFVSGVVAARGLADFGVYPTQVVTTERGAIIAEYLLGRRSLDDCAKLIRSGADFDSVLAALPERTPPENSPALMGSIELAPGWALRVEQGSTSDSLPSPGEGIGVLLFAGEAPGGTETTFVSVPSAQLPFLSGIAKLYEMAVPITWPKKPDDGLRRVPLPTYAWQRQRYWIEGTDFEGRTEES